jgi:predicted transposase YdaD
METDSLFYRLFKEKPKLLFELLGEKIPKTIYTFGSYEVKQTRENSGSPRIAVVGSRYSVDAVAVRLRC